MKSTARLQHFCISSIVLILLCSCAGKDEAPQEADVASKVAPIQKTVQAPNTLPLRFQGPQFLAEVSEQEKSLDLESEALSIKVGATIRSTGGPQPLWDIMNRLTALKGMSVSWAGDVNRKTLVDVNINAEDDFDVAIDNLLRQADYFKEIEGKTVIVKYRETKKFYIPMPYMKGKYTTNIGGNFLADVGAYKTKEENVIAATGTEGTVKVTSTANEFDLWENIRSNVTTIMNQWTVNPEQEELDNEDKETSNLSDELLKQALNQGKQAGGGSEQGTEKKEELAKPLGYFTIDKTVGLLTVTAPRPLLEKVELYVESLKKELFRQVAIDAKIIEVYLQDDSRIGLDWSTILKDFSVTGTTVFGNDGLVYTAGGSSSSFISSITMSNLDFEVMLNALKEQGETNVLSNPKITVLNGQPAMISMGTDVTYISSVETSVSNSDGAYLVTYTVETGNVVEGIALGVMASIIEDDEVILHLSPITTDLEDDPIEYETFGNDGGKIGLPRLRVRNMSTMVKVQSGEMLVIGGLIDSVESGTGSFAPVVGDIPLVKYLFGYEEKVKQRRELVVLLIPTIL